MWWSDLRRGTPSLTLPLKKGEGRRPAATSRQALTLRDSPPPSSGGGSGRGCRAFLATLVLAGCGFAPVYGPGGGAEGLRGSIRVEAPETRPEFELVAQLESRLGQPTAATHDLSFTLTTREVAVGITPEQETTRYHVVGELDFRLTETGTGAIATSGKVESFTAYAATGSTVSADAATEDAYRRLAVILADQLVARLQVTAGDWR